MNLTTRGLENKTGPEPSSFPSSRPWFPKDLPYLALQVMAAGSPVFRYPEVGHFHLAPEAPSNWFLVRSPKSCSLGLGLRQPLSQQALEGWVGLR